MRKILSKILLFALLANLIGVTGYSQVNPLRRLPGGGGGFRGGGGGQKQSNDTLQKRNALQDSITISFRYLDSSRMQKFDSSIYDFTQRFPVPWYHYHLGNVGNATHSMIFPELRGAGWDHGFHAYDVYNFTAEQTKFYNTTRPYTEIQYQIGSKLEQLLGVLHTQNVMPNWNMAFQYRLINSPGFFKNQNTNHNNYQFSSWYTSKNKRYQNYLIIVGNKLLSAENGGIRDDRNYLDSGATFSTLSNIPTRLGPITEGQQRNFFASDITTGTRYTNAAYIMRHQYDLYGNKDSIVTDSTVIPLFYPRIRAELTTSLKTYNYRYIDNSTVDSFAVNFYKNAYNVDTPGLIFRDYWRDFTNDFSIYQFPDAKNSQQFFKAGASFQMLKGLFDTGSVTNNYHNFFVHGEYRNKTRDKKWDIEAFGNLYLNGMNAGDYNAHVSLKRLISKNIGYLQLGFSNVNRTPSFVFDSTSSFYLGEYHNFNKENYTEIFSSLDLPKIQTKLTGRYLLISNYTYFKDYKEADQYGTLFNLLQITGEKQFRLGKNWNWRTWVVIQQLTGNPPLNLPFFLTRNQIGYDGKLGFKNLLISFGLEMRYFTPYKADRYSPVIGQFFNQETKTVKLKAPDIAAYMHFRIKSFTAYIRLENLNSLDPATGQFTNNSIYSPDYPYPGMQMRIGVYWSFVN